MQDDFVEKRKYARLDIPMRVGYKFSVKDKPRTALSKNISKGGMLLLAKERMDVGAQITMEIYLTKEDTNPIRTVGQVVWQGKSRTCAQVRAKFDRENNGVYNTGISFSDLKDDDMERFFNYCFTQMYKMVKMPEWYMKKS